MEETTNPASADCGMRTFQVRDLAPDGKPQTVIDVSVCKLEDRALDGEASQLLEIQDSVPSNHDIGMALINLGIALLNNVGKQLTNPDD